MSDANPPIAIGAGTPRRRSGLLAGTFMGLAVFTLMLGDRWPTDGPAVPSFDQRGMDRVVLDLLSDVRARVQRQPREAEVWGQYGQCLLQHERPREALACFRRAGQLDPANPRWPWFSAMILEQTDLNAAAADLRLAYALSPDALHVRLKLAATELALGNPAATEELLQPVPGDSPAAAQSALQRARAARLQNTPQAVLTILNAARGTPGSLSAELLEEAAMAALQTGQSELAQSLRHEALQSPRQPDFQDPWLAGLRAFDVSGGADSVAADQLRAQGRLGEAATRLALLARRFPDRSRPALNLALAHRDQGQAQLASMELRQLADRFPTDPLVRFHLAVTEAQLGSIEAAMAALNACLQLKPDYGVARAALADLLAASGKLPEAVIQAEQAAADAPGEIWIHFGRIRLLLAAGHTDRARQALELATTLPLADGRTEQVELQQLRQELAAAKTTEGANP
ncbi:MAG: tetratricopeptide repeat protein [Planctomycetota bacterium]